MRTSNTDIEEQNYRLEDVENDGYSKKHFLQFRPNSTICMGSGGTEGFRHGRTRYGAIAGAFEGQD